MKSSPTFSSIFQGTNDYRKDDCIPICSAAQAAEKASPPSRRRYDQLEKDGDEDNEDLVEQAARYDREWDDWKDDHPRGSGNKANKRI